MESSWALQESQTARAEDNLDDVVTNYIATGYH